MLGCVCATITVSDYNLILFAVATLFLTGFFFFRVRVRFVELDSVLLVRVARWS